jgi:hypothetical protein
VWLHYNQVYELKRFCDEAILKTKEGILRNMGM